MNTSTTTSTEQANPRIAIPLLVPAMAQGLVIAGAGVVLVFAPTLSHDIWGWELTPFNTRFLGAIYLAALGERVCSHRTGGSSADDDDVDAVHVVAALGPSATHVSPSVLRSIGVAARDTIAAASASDKKMAL